MTNTTNEAEAKSDIALVLDQTELAVLFRRENGLDPIISEIERRVMAHQPDTTSREGRKAIGSLAYDVARAKNELDRRGKELNEDAQRQIAVVNTERKRYWNRLEALQSTARAPLDAWEAAEQVRIDTLQNRLAQISDGGLSSASSTTDLAAQVDVILAVVVDETWEEFEPLAVEAKTLALAGLRDSLAAAEVREERDREIEQLRADAARRDEEDRRRKEAEAAAAEAERKKREAEEAERQRVIDEQAATIKRMQDEQAAREKADADRVAENAAKVAEDIKRREQAEADAKAKAERDAQEAERLRQQQEADRIAAEQREADRIAREKRIADEAAEAERQRLERIRADEEAAANKRAADVKRRNEVRAEIVDALADMAGNATPDAIADAMMAGEIPHVTVTF